MTRLADVITLLFKGSVVSLSCKGYMFWFSLTLAGVLYFLFGLYFV